MKNIDFDDLWNFTFVPIAKMILSSFGILALFLLLILLVRLVFWF